MIFLFGAPCSGKSTILKNLKENYRFNTFVFDTLIEEQIKKNKIKDGTTLTDNFIDETIQLYFTKLDNLNKTNLVCEIPYHNYEKLINNYPVIKSNRIITLNAPLETLLKRNSNRVKLKQIPEAYIKRCFMSIERVNQLSNITSFDTSSNSVKEITNAINELK